MAGRPWERREDKFLRLWYRDATPAEMADALGRSASAVENRLHTLRLRRFPHWPPAVYDRVRALHAEGLTDVDIARRMADVFRGGDPRSQAHNVRRRLGLPANAAAVKEAGRRAVATQRERLGIRHGGDLRAWAFRRFARQSGWPEDLRPREVQVLNVLCEHGPATAAGLARRIGMRTDLKNSVHGGPAHLKGNGPGGTYTASLMRRGLVAYLHRAVKGRGKGGRAPGLYLATPKAVALREGCLERYQRDERERGAGPRGGAADAHPGGGPGARAAPGRGRGVGGEAPRRRVRRDQGGRRPRDHGQAGREGPGR